MWNQTRALCSFFPIINNSQSTLRKIRNMFTSARWLLWDVIWVLILPQLAVLQWRRGMFPFPSDRLIWQRINHSSIMMRSALMSTFPWITDFLTNKDENLGNQEAYKVRVHFYQEFTYWLTFFRFSLRYWTTLSLLSKLLRETLQTTPRGL